MLRNTPIIEIISKGNGRIKVRTRLIAIAIPVHIN
jgi:hypothetical protein